MLCLRMTSSQSDRQRAANGPYAAIERQLAYRKNVGQVSCITQVTICPKNSKRNGQIETSPFLAHVRWRQVNRRLMKRKEECAVVDGRANALTRFTHSQIGQSNYDYRGRRIRFSPHWR